MASDRSTEATEQPVKTFRPVTKLWFAEAARAGARKQNKHDGQLGQPPVPESQLWLYPQETCAALISGQLSN